jgi:hypothetical protein
VVFTTLNFILCRIVYSWFAEVLQFSHVAVFLKMRRRCGEHSYMQSWKCGSKFIDYGAVSFENESMRR